MKIAILAHTLFPICEPYAGGMEMITHILAKKLTARGHDVDIFAVKGSDPELNLVEYASCSDEQQTNSPQGDRPDRFECYQISEALLKITAGGYDVVHNNTQHYLPILLGEKMNVPFITTFHIPAFEFLLYPFQYLNKNPRQCFTSVSNSLSRVYAAHGVTSKTIYNGIDLKAWDYRQRAVDNALIWFGRICPEKGTHQAIKVAKQLDIKLYLAGPISNPDYFRSQIEHELNSDKIVYIGHLEHLALNELIGRCRATLFLSTWEEPYGLAIAESLACGTPVVAWEKGAAPEILTADCGVLVPEGDFSGLVKAVGRAFAMDREHCRRRAEQFCSIEDMVSAYEHLYAEMCSIERENKIAAVW